MKYFEGYKDFIGKGMQHSIYNIDDDWVLKMPILPAKLTPEQKKRKGLYLTIPETLDNFNDYYIIMKNYPEIFPKVKKLDKYRIAVEKCDTETPKVELQYIIDNISLNSPKIIQPKHLLYNLYYNVDDTLRIIGKTNNDICKKWFSFINKVKKAKLENIIKRPFIDLHIANIGIDKTGELKLIDF